MRSFLRGLPALLLATFLASGAAAAPVILDFDTLPPPPWVGDPCGGDGNATVNGGVMTLETPGCYEWSLDDPKGEWHQKVDNAKGWAIETRVLVDPKSDDEGGTTSSVMLWINDHTNMLIVGLTNTAIRLEYPEFESAPMDTTDAFHVVRIVSKLNHVRIYVDGALRIDHTLTQPGAGSNTLFFGDGDGGAYSLSYWDYFWYDVDCGDACDPGGACVEGAPCDDGNACTQNDVCQKGVCAGVGVSCPPSDECHEVGTCDPGSGCTAAPKPDGTPCSNGVCLGGACTSVTNTTSSSSSGAGGSGGAIPADYPIYGRATCACELGAGRHDAYSPAWLLAGLAAAWRARLRSRSARRR